MFRKRNISVYSDLKTGFFCRFFLILGFIFLAFVVVQYFTSFLAVSENVLGTILAFSIIFLGLGVILYFFMCQFAKLAEIAREIENEDFIE